MADIQNPLQNESSEQVQKNPLGAIIKVFAAITVGVIVLISTIAGILINNANNTAKAAEIRHQSEMKECSDKYQNLTTGILQKQGVIPEENNKVVDSLQREIRKMLKEVKDAK